MGTKIIKAVNGILILCILPGLVTAQNRNARLERRICTWVAAGPFEPVHGDGFDQDFLGGEANATPKLGDSANGKNWLYFDDRLYCRNHDDYNDFFTFFMEGRPGGPGGGTENKVAYAASYVWSPEPLTVRLNFGANEKAKVWLNGNLEIEQSTPSQAMRDITTRTVQLRQGWNPILVKVVNIYEIWGFYLGMTDPQGNPLKGYEFTPDRSSPDRDLQVVTPAMPGAYSTQPYVHLTVRNPEPKYPADNPSASPFRFCARGGTPPYTWNVQGLPAGLTLDPAEGEITGTTAQTDEGEHVVSVTVADSASPPHVSHKQFAFLVKPRVTRKWWETGTRMGGLRHGGEFQFDRAEEEAKLAALQGVSWIAPTGLDIFHWDGHREKLVRGPAVDFYKQTMEKHGIRICNYIGIPDHFINPPLVGVSALHERLKQHMEQDHPGLFWLDGSGNTCRRPVGGPNLAGESMEVQSWEFDALYSLVKTIDPDCLILANAGGGDHKDWELGDIDLLSLEGNNNHGPVNYWSRWPSEESGKWWRNPKFLPIDSWRFAEPGADDWRIWTKSFVTLLSETENIKRPRMVNFDLSPSTATLEIHRAIGNWIHPRRDAVLGCFPEAEMTVGARGYCVFNQAHPEIRYVHLISNERGKTGWSSGDVLAEYVPFTVESIKLYPQMKDLHFSQNGSTVTVNMAGIKPDEIDTILQVLPRQ